MTSSVDPTSGGAALCLSNLTAGYGDSVVLRSVNLTVRRGSVVALIGANGAGKTTLLRAAAGLVTPNEGAIYLGGVEVTTESSYRRAERGLCLIPEGRGVFRPLTVAENLQMQVPRRAGAEAIERGLEVFPALRDRLKQRAGTLSGGEQQMLALCRSFVCDPSVVLLDEVSMGLAPKIVEGIFAAIRVLASRGISLLLVEQYVEQAISMADEVVVLTRGKVTRSGSSSDVDRSALVKEYLAGHG